MDNKITVVMSQREYKKFLAYKEADKIVGSIRRSLCEVKEARDGKRKLKPAYELANELWSRNRIWKVVKTVK